MEKKIPEHSISFADELEDRLVNFAVRIIKLAACLPRNPAGKHIAGQIVRSGTSPAPNYGEARGAESRADFVHKLRIVLKELNENVDMATNYRTKQVVEEGVVTGNYSGKW